MVGINQGGRSSRPSPAVNKKWRARLKRLDRRCTAAEKLLMFQTMMGFDSSAAARIYRKADMERMLIRRRMKGYVES